MPGSAALAPVSKPFASIPIAVCFMTLAIIFDLDGTLIDSLPTLARVVDRALVRAGLAPVGEQAVRPMIGDGAHVLLTRAFAARGATFTEADWVAFRADYDREAAEGSPLFPGIIEALEALEGRKMAVCTNKPQAAADLELAKLGLTRFFPVVIGGDALAFRKPDPRHAAACLERLGEKHAVMIGDHPNDLAAAAALDWPSIYCSWGYGTAQATLVANAAAELPDRLAGLIASRG